MEVDVFAKISRRTTIVSLVPAIAKRNAGILLHKNPRHVGNTLAGIGDVMALAFVMTFSTYRFALPASVQK
jgi:hypothetical protein